jgi:hypothetical protein
MLTFDNLTLDDLLTRAGRDARREADSADVESTGGSDPVVHAQEIVAEFRRQIPTLCADSTWVDYVEIKFGSNPRVELKFRVRAIAPEKVLIHYQASQELDVPLSVGENEWVFTYGVDYDFDPDETKARFLTDLGATQEYLTTLRAREASRAETLVADVADCLRKRRFTTISVADRVSAMGYPTEDPFRVDPT